MAFKNRPSNYLHGMRWIVATSFIFSVFHGLAQDQERIMVPYQYGINNSDSVIRATIDSLKKILSAPQDDTSRVLTLLEYASYYAVINADTALAYNNRAIELSRRVKFPAGEYQSLDNRAWVLNMSSNYVKSLETYFKAAKVAKTNGFRKEEAISYLMIGAVYDAGFKDEMKSRLYTGMAKSIFDSIHNTEWSSISENHIARIFMNEGMLDSSDYYAAIAFDHFTKYNIGYMLGYNYWVRGLTAEKRGNNTEAISLFKQGLLEFEKTSDYLHHSNLNYRIGRIFQALNKSDSAVIYANRALLDARMGNFYLKIIDAGNLLAELYKPMDINKAFEYSQLASAAKDSLYQYSTKNALESFITFDEQERQHEIEAARESYENKVKQYALVSGVAVFFLIAIILYRNNREKRKANKILEATLDNLRNTQNQLIHAEKMASLGELTAGIAHEIQNPLNFVNNFSEISEELIDELDDELGKGNISDAKNMAADIRTNIEKIKLHGKRAENIVKGMLQHSRTSSGQKEPVNINDMADEYFRLAVQLFKSKDHSFHVRVKTDFDPAVGEISLVPQDISKVLLNVYNNAFYAVNEKIKQQSPGYEPAVTVSTKRQQGMVEVSISDNGIGIPGKIVSKIFQPFFTTKPAGQGTGLGLSLSYDIIKAHGGEMRVSSTEEEGTSFIILLPE